MEYSINIGKFTVHSVSNNANINFQATNQSSHTANSKIIGSCYNFGDESTLFCCEKSIYSDACHDDNSSDSQSSGSQSSADSAPPKTADTKASDSGQSQPAEESAGNPSAGRSIDTHKPSCSGQPLSDDESSEDQTASGSRDAQVPADSVQSCHPADAFADDQTTIDSEDS